MKFDFILNKLPFWQHNNDKLPVKEYENNAEQILEAVILKEESEPPAYWNIWQGILCFASIFVFTNCFAVFLNQGMIEQQITNIILTLFQESLTVALPLIIVLGYYNYDVSYLGFRKIEKASYIFKAILSGIGYYLIAVFLILIISLVYPFDINIQSSFLPLLEADNRIIFALWLLITGIIGPFAEEVFFRGFLYAALRNKIAFIPSAIIAGTLFGAVHFDLLRLIPIALFGFMLCKFYEKYKNIWLNTIVHMSFNCFSLLLLILNKNI